MASLLDQIDPLATRVSLLDRLSQGEQVTQQERDALDQASSNSMGELEKGLRRSGYNLTASTEAFVGQMAEPFAPEFARRRFAGANETLRSMPTSLTPAVSSFAEAQRTGDYLPYAAGALGEGLGSTIPTVIAGLLTRGATLRAAPAVQNAASFVAGAGTMLPQEGGETALQLQNSPQALANTTPAERAALTLGRGTVGAVAETLVPEMLLTRPLAGAARAIEPGLRSAAGNFGRKAVAGGLGEAGTEAAQELVGQYAQNLAVPGTGYDLERVKEAAIAGALPGTVIGGTGAMVQAARSNLGAGIQKSTEASNKLLNTAVEQLDSALRNPEEFGYTAGNATLGALAEASARVKEFGPAAASAMDTIAAMRQQFDRAVVGRLTPENRQKYLDLTQDFRLLQPTEYERLRDALNTGDPTTINEAIGDVAYQFRERVPRETFDGMKNLVDWAKKFGKGVTTAAREGRKASAILDPADVDRFKNFLARRYPGVFQTLERLNKPDAPIGDTLTRALIVLRGKPQTLDPESPQYKDPGILEKLAQDKGGVSLRQLMEHANAYHQGHLTRREEEQAYEGANFGGNTDRVISNTENQLTDAVREDYEARGVEIGPGATNEEAPDDAGTSPGMAEEQNIGTFGQEWMRQNPSYRRDDGELMNEEDPRTTGFSSLGVVQRMMAKKIFRRDGTLKAPDPRFEIPSTMSSDELSPALIGRLLKDRVGAPPAPGEKGWGSKFEDLSAKELKKRITKDGLGYRQNFNAVDIAAQAGTPEERGGSKESLEKAVPGFDGTDNDFSIQGHRLLAAITDINANGIDIPRNEIPADILKEAGLDADGPAVHINVTMDPNSLHDDLQVQVGKKNTTIADFNGVNRTLRSRKSQHKLLAKLLRKRKGTVIEHLNTMAEKGGRPAKTAQAVLKGLGSFAYHAQKKLGDKTYPPTDAAHNTHALGYLSDLQTRITKTEDEARAKHNQNSLYDGLVDGAFQPNDVKNNISILENPYSEEEIEAYDEGRDDEHDIDPESLTEQQGAEAWARELGVEFDSPEELHDILTKFRDGKMDEYLQRQETFDDSRSDTSKQEPTADDELLAWRRSHAGIETRHMQAGIADQKDAQHLKPRRGYVNKMTREKIAEDASKKVRAATEAETRKNRTMPPAEQRANDAETNVLDIGADARQAAANRHLENRLLAPLNKAMAATNSVMAVRRLKNGLTRAVAISDAPFDQAILDEAIQAGDITAHNVEVTQPRGAAEAATVLVKRDSFTDHFFRSLNTNGVIRIAASKLDKLEQLKESVVQKAASQEAEAAPVAPIQETPPAKPKPTREELRAKNAELRERLRAETAPKPLNAVQRGVITKAITRLKTVPELDELQAGLPALAEADAAFVNGLIDQQRAALAPRQRINAVNVWAGSNENTELSNLAKRPFTYDGREYLGVEHAYQTLKSGAFDNATYAKYGRYRNAPRLGKIAGRQALTKDGANIRLMEALMRASFEQNPEAMSALQATRPHPITHAQDRGIWRTEFPRILTEIREGQTSLKTPAAETPTEADDSTPLRRLQGSRRPPVTALAQADGSKFDGPPTVGVFLQYGEEFVVHRDLTNDKKWAVSHKDTGRGVIKGAPSIARAAEQARAYLQENGRERVKRAVGAATSAQPAEQAPPKTAPTREQLRAKNQELLDRVRAEPAPKTMNAMQRGVFAKDIRALPTVEELKTLWSGVRENTRLTAEDKAFIREEVRKRYAQLTAKPQQEPARQAQRTPSPAPPEGPPQGPNDPPRSPPPPPPDNEAQARFRAIVERILGKLVNIEFNVKNLGEGIAAEYVSRFGKDLEDTGKALRVVRENRRRELRALKARRTATDEDIADGKADPRTPEQIEESIRSLEAQEQAYLNDLAVRGTIRVASGMEAQAGLAEHEALHAAFKIFFGDNNASDRKAITTAFTQGVLARRLQNYFRDKPDVLAVIDPTSTAFQAEEAAAYGFQVFLHDPGALQMGQKVEGIFNHLLQLLQGLVGYKTYEERARTIFNDLNSGKRAERGTSVLRDRVGMEQSMLSRSQDFVRGVGTGFMHMYDTVLSSTYSRMADSGNAAMAQIARLGYNATGETGQGMIQLQRQQTMQWSNRLKEALHALSVEELGQLNQAMLLNEELSGKLGQAQQRLRTVLTDVHRYQQEAGVDLGYIEDYYPMIWSPEKVSADYQGFIDMLQQYPEQLAEMNATADEVFERIASYEERGHEFQGIFGKDGEPVADSSRRRSLAFISPEDRLKYMEDDLMVTMAHYLNQSVRHAEYVRAYGQNGARMRELLGEIRGVYGGSQDDVDLAKDYIDGLMENKEIGMSRELKDLYGAATVYQNVRLLPLSVFSSLVDPLGVAIRTDSAGAAFDTFTYSLRNLFTDFRKDWTPDMWEKYAADMGTIDMSGTVKSIDKIYTGVTLRGKTREINDGFFKWNLLNGWVKNNHIMATKAAQAYLRRSAEGMFGEERSAENLREAGVQPGDIVFDETLGRIRSFAPEILGYGNADEMEQRATEEEIAGARAQADRIQQAVHKIVRQSLIQPSSAELPGWLNNPYLAPIAHLKTFVFGFNATILNRLVYEAKRGNYNPIYYAAAYVPGMIAADFLKGLAGNGGEEPEWQKNWTAADYLAYGVDRSGLTGTGQFLADMNNDVTRGGGGWESLAGPTIEQAKELMAAMNAKTSKPTETWMRNALPAHALYDQWLK